jgi:hypothetical protein
MQKLGEVAFLSSGGNIHRRTEGVGIANYGKTQWVAKNFPDSSLILTREKYLCASSNTILIDDTEKKIKQFANYGGNTFHFPHPYKIIDGELEFQDVLKGLERKIERMEHVT